MVARAEVLVLVVGETKRATTTALLPFKEEEFMPRAARMPQVSVVLAEQRFLVSKLRAARLRVLEKGAAVVLETVAGRLTMTPVNLSLSAAVTLLLVAGRMMAPLLATMGLATGART